MALEITKKAKDFIFTMANSTGLLSVLEKMDAENVSRISDGEILNDSSDYSDQDIFDSLTILFELFPKLRFKVTSMEIGEDIENMDMIELLNKGIEHCERLISSMRECVFTTRTEEEKMEQMMGGVEHAILKLLDDKDQGFASENSHSLFKIIGMFVENHPDLVPTLITNIIAKKPDKIFDVLALITAVQKLLDIGGVLDEEDSRSIYCISLYHSILTASLFQKNNGDYDFLDDNTAIFRFKELIPNMLLLMFRELYTLSHFEEVKANKGRFVSTQTIDDAMDLAKEVMSNPALEDNEAFCAFIATLISSYVKSFTDEEIKSFLTSFKKILKRSDDSELTEEDAQFLREKAFITEGSYMGLYDAEDISEYAPSDLREILDSKYGKQSPPGDFKETKTDFETEISDGSKSEKKTFDEMYKDLI